jgi:outer membrane immunogenic protein
MNRVTRISPAIARRSRGLRAGFTALALVLIAQSAAAGGLDTFLRGSFTTAAASRWDGVNFGVQLGVTNMNADFIDSTSSLVAYMLRDTLLEKEFQPSRWRTLPSTTTNGRQNGAFLGYNVQWDQLVVGFDVAYNRVSTLETSVSDFIAREVTTSDKITNDVTIVAQSSLRLIDYATVRARAGYAFGQFLPYAFVGAAAGRFNYATTATVITSGIDNTTTPPTPKYGPIVDSRSDAKDNAVVGGVVAGLGMDVALLPNLFLRGEWEYIAFAPVGGTRANINTGRVGIGMKF